MTTPRSNVGSSRRSESRSRTAWSHVRLTVQFGVSIDTVGSFGRSVGWPTSTALQASVAGRRRPDVPALEPVYGSHFRQVCQTPFGLMFATKTRRPFAYSIGELALSTAATRWRANAPVV